MLSRDNHHKTNHYQIKSTTMKNTELGSHSSTVSDIDYMYVDRGFTMLMLKDGRQDVVGLPLGEIERRLVGEKNFFRIHKSYIVNLARVKELLVSDNGVCLCINGQTLPVARRRKRALFNLLYPKR